MLKEVVVVSLLLLTLAALSQDRGITVQEVAVQAQRAQLPGYDPARLHVLLIGVNGYEDWPVLSTPEADTQAIAETLMREYAVPETNLTMVTGKAATRRGILKALDDHMDLGTDDSLIVYYAGHGAIDKHENGFWVPVDAKVGDPYGYLSNAQLVNDYFRKFEGKHLLVIADSCFAGAIFRGEARPLPGRRLPAGFYRPSRWIMASGDMELVQDDAGNGHSPFANRVLQFLRYSDDPVFGMNDLYVYVRQHVDSEVVAQPIDSPHHVPGGELVLVRGTGGVLKVEHAGGDSYTQVKVEAATPIGEVGSIAVLSWLTGELSLDGHPVAAVGPGFRYPIHNVPVGSHRLEIVGDKKWSQEVEVYPRRTTSVEARLPTLPTKSWPRLGQEWVVPDIGANLVHVSPGSFLRGDHDGKAIERPVQSVKIGSDFWIGATEVTVAQYLAYLRTSEHPDEGDYSRLHDFKHTWGKWRSRGDEDLPAAGISWEQARDFCSWLTEREGRAGRLPPGYVYRLPTESEWEFATRCGINWTYFYGENQLRLNEYGWHEKNARGKRHPVGELKSNGNGLYDTYGNVGEWCLDAYQPYSAIEHPLVDPLATMGKRRVVRGGSYKDDAASCTSASRAAYDPQLKRPDVGFRMVLAPSM